MSKKIIKPKPPHLRAKSISPDKKDIFQEIESRINSQIEVIIFKLESIRSELIEEVKQIREEFENLESDFKAKDFELCDFINQNGELESKRNTLVDMQNYHIATLKKKLQLHRKDKPLPPYMNLSCETNRIIDILERIKLITYSSNAESISISEERIKDWKSMPESVTVDNTSGHVYYSDPDNSCVRSYNTQGGYVGEIGLWSSKMLTPKSIAILKDELFVADTGLNHISKFNLTTHEFITNTKAPLTFTNPIAITFNEKEELYILDQRAKKLTVLNSNLQFVRGYRMKLAEDAVPLDFKVFNGTIYMMMEKEVVWFEEPKNSSLARCEENDLAYEISYNSIIKTSSECNHHLYLDEVGNIIRTENNGQLVINAPNGEEIFRKSFMDADGVENLTGVCITDKGCVVVGVSNRDHILHILHSNNFEKNTQSTDV